jgi:prephenate dehydrogenase
VEADEVARRLFVGAHPIAGSEQRGVCAARADLFDRRVCVLTPTERTPIDRRNLAERFWSSLGCRVEVLDPEAHDAALARTSHLPHVVAAALALSVSVEALDVAAGAYRDGTRVAAADTDLWVAIFRENPEHLLNALAEYRHHLDQFREALANDDPTRLRSLWDQARSLRLQFREPGPR